MYSWMWLGFMMLGIVSGADAGDNTQIKLPAPQTEQGRPLMQVLMARHSTREFSAKPLSLQTLSDLLWAADGVNRQTSGKRTAPSARDWREIAIYAVSAEGVYRFDATAHVLNLVRAGDFRADTGTQDFVGTAPLNLVYVADLRRMEGADPEMKTFYAAADTGFIAENVYLYCASAGLATVVRGSIEWDSLATVLKLDPEQRAVLAQTVGYPE